MNPDDLKKILDALSLADVREFSLKTGSFALDLKRGPQAVAGPAFAASHSVPTGPAPTGPAAPLPGPAASFQPSAPSVEAGSAPARSTESLTAPVAEDLPAAAPAKAVSAGTPVKAPIVGTFYSASSPDAPAYVKVGDTVSAGQILCIIEAMKLMNEIEAEMSGTVREILVKNAEPVEYGQTLFIIE